LALFRGTFDHTLDAKNRLTVPARYRDQFEAGAVLAMPFDARPCVGLWRPADYDAVTGEALSKLPALGADRSQLERFLYGSSQDGELDRAGRIMIPVFLATHASLVKDVMVVGAGNRLELWNREAWEENRPALYEGITEVIARVASTA
jgi:MraZ protein